MTHQHRWAGNAVVEKRTAIFFLYHSLCLVYKKSTSGMMFFMDIFESLLRHVSVNLCGRQITVPQ